MSQCRGYRSQNPHGSGALEYRDGWTSGAKPFLYGLAAVAVIVFIGWYVAAGVYRSQHCIYILGHWVEMSRTGQPVVLPVT